MTAIQPRKVYRIGDENTDIVTSDSEIAWNNFLRSLDEIIEAISILGAEIEHEETRQRQRVKDDVRQKRKAMMKRRGRK